MKKGQLFVQILCCLALGSMYSCRQEPVESPSREMVGLLASLQEAAERSSSFPYFNRLRAERQAERLQGLPYDVPISQRLEYVRELLWAGMPERCIVELEMILQSAFPGKGLTPATEPYYRLLALAYLRLGEQENCLGNHDAQSCIIPIEGGGVHRLSAGSEQAADLYLQLLAYDSTDLQSRWLLNIAFMTLGEYPDGVPSDYLIPEEAFASEYNLLRFPDVATEWGVDVRGHAGGCSLEDFDGDGRLDIFTTSYIIGEQCRLFINTGQKAFRDRTVAAGLAGITGGLNNTHADYNNDGRIDIFVTRGGWLGEQGLFPNSLLENLGGGRFRDVTDSAGLLAFHPSQTSAWADVNLDGRLDLFVGNESTGGRSHPCELYLNQGDGTFRNVADSLGLDISAYVKGAVWGDINNDGRPDLFLSVFGGQNRLFVNREGDEPDSWHFEEIAGSAGVTEPKYAFPCWFFDYDNDGWEDLFVSGYHEGNSDQIGAVVAAGYLGRPFHSGRPRLFRNRGDETFEDVTDRTGLNHPLFTMGCNFGDLDNDGWLDFYLGTGEFSLWATVPNRMFRNDGGRRFQDVTTAGGFGQIQKGHGVAFGDIDGDGDQDIYAVTGGAVEGDVYPNMLFLNPGGDHQWIKLGLEGRTANRSAIGARLRLVVTEAGGEKRAIFRTVRTGGSFGNSSLRLEIGLGSAARVDTLEVRWPNRERTIQRWTGLEAGRGYKIAESRAPQPLPR